jgi:hypothetical protein
MEKEIEIFKIFKDTRYNPFGALWEVSNFGNVRKNGDIYIPFENSENYLFFGNHIRLHRAVAELFIPNPENKQTVDHINRDKHDNRVCNLRWATYKEQAENRDNDAISKFISKSKIGNTNTLGKVWVFNPTTDQSARIDPSQLPEFLDKGYIRGRKIKK